MPNTNNNPSLSRDTTSLDNEWLIKQARENKIIKAVSQIRPSKGPCPDGRYVVVYKKKNIGI